MPTGRQPDAAPCRGTPRRAARPAARRGAPAPHRDRQPRRPLGIADVHPLLLAGDRLAARAGAARKPRVQLHGLARPVGHARRGRAARRPRRDPRPPPRPAAGARRRPRRRARPAGRRGLRTPLPRRRSLRGAGPGGRVPGTGARRGRAAAGHVPGAAAALDAGAAGREPPPADPCRAPPGARRALVRDHPERHLRRLPCPSAGRVGRVGARTLVRGARPRGGRRGRRRGARPLPRVLAGGAGRRLLRHAAAGAHPARRATPPPGRAVAPVHRRGSRRAAARARPYAGVHAVRGAARALRGAAATAQRARRDGRRDRRGQPAAGLRGDRRDVREHHSAAAAAGPGGRRRGGDGRGHRHADPVPAASGRAGAGADPRAGHAHLGRGQPAVQRHVQRP